MCPSAAGLLLLSLINARHPAEQLLNRNAFILGRLRRLPSGNALIHPHASASSTAPLGLGSRSGTAPGALLLSSQLLRLGCVRLGASGDVERLVSLQEEAFFLGEAAVAPFFYLLIELGKNLRSVEQD